MRKARVSKKQQAIVKKRKRIVRLIREIWDSLDSHLDHTHSVGQCKYCGGSKFHIDTSKGYNKNIADLLELL